MREPRNASPSTPVIPGRRAFLAGLLGESPSDADCRLPRIPAERIALLRDIVLRWEHRLPEGAVPELRASDACAGHGVCATVCPTGALRGFEAPGVRGLDFDAAACFACGACVVVCPEEALRLEARSPAAAPAGVERLTQHRLRICVRCDDEFTAHGEDELCPACRKGAALFTALFANRLTARSEET